MFPVELDALKWKLEPASTTEGQTFYVTTNEGLFAFVQVVYSSINSWSPSVQITARVYTPDGNKKVINKTVGGPALELSADRLSLKCDTAELKYKEGSHPRPFYHIVFSVVPDLLIEIEFESIVDVFHTAKDHGKRLFDEEDPTIGYISSQLIAKANVKGQIVVDGKVHDAAGFGAFVHALQNQPQNVARWNFVNFQNKRDALILYQYETPEGRFKENVVSQGSLVIDNKTMAITINNKSVFEETEYDDFSGYQIPKSVKHTWEGVDSSEQPIKIELSLNLDRLLDKIDVLSELPFLVRTFIQTFITAPFVYQWFEYCKVIVTRGSETTVLQGHTFHENTFLLELENDE